MLNVPFFLPDRGDELVRLESRFADRVGPTCPGPHPFGLLDPRLGLEPPPTERRTAVGLSRPADFFEDVCPSHGRVTPRSGVTRVADPSALVFAPGQSSRDPVAAAPGVGCEWLP